MPTAVLILLAALSAVPPVFAFSSPRGLREQALAEAVCCEDFRHQDAAKIFQELERRGRPSAEALFLMGYAQMRLRRPERAEPLLRGAVQSGFTGLKDWPDPRELLSRAEEAARYLPPRVAAPGLDDAEVWVHADRLDARFDAVLKELPEFMRIGRRIYGDRLPFVRLVLISDRAGYERFCRAMFGSSPEAWVLGVGDVNIAVFGGEGGISGVLHELGHAWASGYLMLRHNKDILRFPMRLPWFDEGMGEYVAALWLEDRLWNMALVEDSIKEEISPPDFSELQTWDGFYERGKGKRDLNYPLSMLLVESLLGAASGSERRIPDILDAAARFGSMAEAVKEVTGKDPRQEYDALVRDLWRRN